jgi:uncharacterized membrane protein YtjA (UPF0391 family)
VGDSRNGAGSDPGPGRAQSESAWWRRVVGGARPLTSRDVVGAPRKRRKRQNSRGADSYWGFLDAVHGRATEEVANSGGHPTNTDLTTHVASVLGAREREQRIEEVALRLEGLKDDNRQRKALGWLRIGRATAATVATWVVMTIFLVVLVVSLLEGRSVDAVLLDWLRSAEVSARGSLVGLLSSVGLAS